MIVVGVCYRYRILNECTTDRASKAVWERFFFFFKIFSLIVFWILTLILTFYTLIADLECTSEFQKRTDLECTSEFQKRTDICYLAAQNIFAFGQIICLFALGNKSFQYSALLNFCLKALVLANMCIWFYDIWQTVREAIVEPCPVNVTVANASTRVSGGRMSNSTSSRDDLKNLEPYLSPFVTEYCLLAASMVFDIQMFDSEESTQHLNHEMQLNVIREQSADVMPVEGPIGSAFSMLDDDSVDETTFLLVNRRERLEDSASSTGYLSGRPTTMVDCVGYLFGLSLLVPLVIGVFYIMLMFSLLESNYTQIIVCYSIYLVYLAGTLLILLFGFLKLRRECALLEKVAFFKASELTLIFCYFVILFYHVLSLISSMSLMWTLDFAAIMLCDSCLNILNAWMQTTLIIIANACVKPMQIHLGRRAGIQYVCVFLTVFNFIIYCENTLILHQNRNGFPIQNSYFGKCMWMEIIGVIAPLLIYYRFHSFLSFIKLSLKFSFPIAFD